MRPGLPLVCLLLVLGACRSREPRFAVERVELTGETMVGNPWLGLEPAQLEALFTSILKESGRFELSGGRSAPPRAWALTLELPFTREVLLEGQARSKAEVGATLSLERLGAEVPQHYEVVGLGEAPVEGQGPGARRKALHEALRRALAQASEYAVLQLTAAERSDEALLEDLQAKDGRVREMTLRALAERRHPAATSLLISKLQDRDMKVVRRAMGALVEMRARSAVPALIDLTKGRQVGFLREIVFAIGEIGGPEAEAYLFTVAQGHDQPAVQAAAQRALDTLYASRKLGAPVPVSGARRTEERE